MLDNKPFTTSLRRMKLVRENAPGHKVDAFPFILSGNRTVVLPHLFYSLDSKFYDF